MLTNVPVCEASTVANVDGDVPQRVEEQAIADRQPVDLLGPLSTTCPRDEAM
jgi:hypothetical protein